MAGEDAAVVLDAILPLDIGEGEIPQLRRSAPQHPIESHEGIVHLHLPAHLEHQAVDQHGDHCPCQAAYGPLHCLFGGELGSQLVAAEEHAGEQGKGVAEEGGHKGDKDQVLPQRHVADAQERGEIAGGKLSLVVAGKPGIFALERAKKAGIPSTVLRKKDFASQEDYDNALIQTLEDAEIDLVVLAGFLTIIGEKVIRRFENKILNIHPSLIPSFCGEGYYGLRVHEAALSRGVKVTGATVHFVNEICDGGPIVLQKAVSVENGDTPETLQRRVMEQVEWEILPKAVALFCEGRLAIENNIVSIKD